MRSLTALVAVLALAACSRGREPLEPPPAAPVVAAVTLRGAGATFPYPLYATWIDAYQRSHPGVRIDYRSIGSSAGIQQIVERAVDFGASDAPMRDDELARAPGKILHIPTTLGAVVLAYNVRGVPAGLRLTPEVLSAVFLGELTRWDDPRLVALNPGVDLPGDAITVAHRSDGSGTTAVFTGYLAAVSPAWKEKVGAGKRVRFPVGLGAQGNEGVAGLVKTTPGAIGYIELAYARQTGLATATLRNAAGRLVEPTLESISAAGVAPDGEAAYPLSAFTYVLVYQDMTDAAKARALVDFLWWAVHDGQALGGALHHAPLPAEMIARVEALLRSITVAGKPVL